MHFLSILRKSSRLSLINAAGVLLNFLAVTYAAGVLGPDLYGRIGFVLLWISYAGLVRPGFFEGGQRQLMAFLGEEKVELAKRVQNVGISAEMLWNFIPALVLVFVAIPQHDEVRRTAFLLAPLLYLAQGLTRMLGGIFLAHQKWSEYTAGYAIRAAVQPALLIGLVHWAGPIALVVAPAAVELAVAALYLRRAATLGIKWHLDIPTARGLLVTGFPLSVAAIAYWLYRLAGPTCIAFTLTAASLGVYTFASRIIDQVTRFFGDFSNVLMPGLWSNLARAGNPKLLIDDIARINLYLVLLAGFVCNLIQASAAVLVSVAIPRFISSSPVIEVLAFNVILLTIGMTPGLILDSTVVNRQVAHVGIWLVGSVLNYAVNFIALAGGLGVFAIAWNDIAMQICVIAMLYGLVHKYLFANAAGARKVYVPVAALTCVTVAVFGMLNACWPAGVPSGGVGGQAVFLFTRCAAVVTVWGVVVAFFTRSHRHNLQAPSAVGEPAHV